MRFQITAVSVPSWGFVCLNSILRYLLTPFLVVVSTEPTVNPPASGPLNTKLCLVNTAVCLDSFYKSSLLKCNTGRGGKEGPRCERAEGGLLEVGLCLQTSLQAYLHAHKEEKRGFSRTFDKGLRLIGWQRQQKSVTVFISKKQFLLLQINGKRLLKDLLIHHLNGCIFGLFLPPENVSQAFITLTFVHTGCNITVLC